jgi:hypothetical protein
VLSEVKAICPVRAHPYDGDSFGPWPGLRPSTRRLGFVEDLSAEQVEEVDDVRWSAAPRRLRLTASLLAAVVHADQGIV